MRLSYSSQKTFHSCVLKYELLKNRDLLDAIDIVREDSDNNYDLAYGKAIGIGMQSLLAHKDLDRAIFDVARSYSFVESDKKCFEGLVAGLKLIYADFPLDLYELVISEAAIRIWLNEEKTDSWVGFVDGVLRRTDTGKYTILEGKSCGQNRDDLSPLYKNSPQACGYSIVLPELIKPLGGEADFDVLYLVLQVKGKRWLPEMKSYVFHKTETDRLHWLVQLIMDYQQYQHYKQMDFWPYNGDACLTWNRPCPLFNLCDKLKPKDFPLKNPDKIDTETKWDIEISIDTLIANELERQGKDHATISC